MVLGKAYGAVSTVISGATVGAALVPKTQGGVAPTIVPFVGPVPLFAVGVGVLTTILVRYQTTFKDAKSQRRYNFAVTLLAALGASTFIIDHQVGPGMSFWVGGAFGATGAGLVTIMRSKVMVAMIEGVRGGLLKGMMVTATPPSPPPAAPPPPADQPPKTE